MTFGEMTIGDTTRITGYTVRVVSEGAPGRDRFGRPVIRFECEIVDGPDRIGERGPVTFGAYGQVIA